MIRLCQMLDMQIRYCLPLFLLPSVGRKVKTYIYSFYFYFSFPGNFQEEERRKREREERSAREEEFLRSSLRGSRKLQALEESTTKSHPAGGASGASGVVNIAYTGHDEDDDDDVANDPGFANAGLAWPALAQNNYLLNSGMQKIIGKWRDYFFNCFWLRPFQ